MKYVPNTITIIRILVTPVLLVFLMTDTLWGYAWALGLFILASISDYLDGKLARSFEVHSRLGQFLDPFADKVLVLGTFVALAVLIPETAPWWGVALIGFRDLMVTGLRAWAEANGRSIRTLGVAKAKTTVQLVFLIGILIVMTASKMDGRIGEGGREVLAGPYPFYFFLFVVLVTLATGAVYFFRMEHQPHASQNG
ncbi:CDP-diacylglycerol--glycerol-3-phosphate 3-phosphatidyltransferase [Rhodocaloribacter sp.]